MVIGYVVPISAEFRKAHRRRSKKGKVSWVRGAKSFPGHLAIGAGLGALGGAAIGRKKGDEMIGRANNAMKGMREGFRSNKKMADLFGDIPKEEQSQIRKSFMLRGALGLGILGAGAGAGTYAAGKAISAIRNRKKKRRRR